MNACMYVRMQACVWDYKITSLCKKHTTHRCRSLQMQRQDIFFSSVPYLIKQTHRAPVWIWLLMGGVFPIAFSFATDFPQNWTNLEPEIPAEWHTYPQQTVKARSCRHKAYRSVVPSREEQSSPLQSLVKANHTRKKCSEMFTLKKKRSGEICE
jgi:hypothetical protein